ncbi:MAG: HAD family phosphatase [Proteobacteria bacterium]|nr:HAD family phosphatase [Pseudomonadota bacterium]
MEFRAALFDFDGVIVDSTPMHLRGWAHAYEDLFKIRLDKDVLETLVGRSTSSIGSTLAEKSGYAASKSELIKRKADYVYNHMDEIKLIAGAKDFLLALTERFIPYGIVSNAPRTFIKSALEKHKISIPFYFGLEDYRRPKPDAEPYMKGALKMKFSFPDHRSILVFEDSTHGIEAAIAAHMTAIGICSQHEAEILTAAGASRCFKNLEETLQLFENNSL